MGKDVVLLLLFSFHVATFSAWYLSSSAELITLVMGVNIGAGLVGVSLSLLKLFLPGKYKFIYESGTNELG
jgi:hypothetical protein